MIDVMDNLVHSLSQYPRVVYLLYRNPLFENVLVRYPAFNRSQARRSIQFSEPLAK